MGQDSCPRRPWGWAGFSPSRSMCPHGSHPALPCLQSTDGLWSIWRLRMRLVNHVRRQFPAKTCRRASPAPAPLRAPCPGDFPVPRTSAPMRAPGPRRGAGDGPRLSAAAFWQPEATGGFLGRRLRGSITSDHKSSASFLTGKLILLQLCRDITPLFN